MFYRHNFLQLFMLKSVPSLLCDDTRHKKALIRVLAIRLQRATIFPKSRSQASLSSAKSTVFTITDQLTSDRNHFFSTMNCHDPFLRVTICVICVVFRCIYIHTNQPLSYTVAPLCDQVCQACLYCLRLHFLYFSSPKTVRSVQLKTLKYWYSNPAELVTSVLHFTPCVQNKDHWLIDYGPFFNRSFFNQN